MKVTIIYKRFQKGPFAKGFESQKEATEWLKDPENVDVEIININF